MLTTPHLTFFCELETSALGELFSKPDVVEKIKHINAHISLGLLDLSAARAMVVKKLNQSGIPLHAWLLLPQDQGYWFNLDNSDQALNIYREFKQWTAAHGLIWETIGLDIEPDIRLMQSSSRGILPGISGVLRKALSRKNRSSAEENYRELVKTIRLDGWGVESYQFPPIIDERMARSHLLQDLFGILDLPVDREVLMLYSTFYRPHGGAILASYGSQAQAIGVGITGGGVDTGSLVDSRPMTWEELQSDLTLAARFTPQVYIFSLEGCVENGYLARIDTLAWNQLNIQTLAGKRRIDRIRKVFRGFLWAFSRWRLVVLFFAVPVLLVGILRRWKR